MQHGQVYGDCLSRHLSGKFIDYQGKNIVLASRILETGDESYTDSTVIEGTVNLEDLNNSTVILSGFTITGNFNYRTELSSQNIIITNIKILDAGGLSIENSTASISNSLIKGNEFNRTGAAAVISGSTVDFNDIIIDSNTTQNNYGGGVYAHNSSFVTMENVEITNNYSIDQGEGYSYRIVLCQLLIVIF